MCSEIPLDVVSDCKDLIYAKNITFAGCLGGYCHGVMQEGPGSGKPNYAGCAAGIPTVQCAGRWQRIPEMGRFSDVPSLALSAGDHAGEIPSIYV